MFKYAPKTLAALGRTQLIRQHPAAELRSALLSTECDSCGEYGPFLHLPTCKRCCYCCLGRHAKLWVIPISMAKDCFGITDAQLKRLPVMRSTPGRYSVRYGISRLKPLRLVSVEAVKRLVVAENGFDEHKELNELRDKYINALVSEKDFSYYSWLQAATLQTPESESVPPSLQPCNVNDRYCGMASIPFPHLTATSTFDEGAWCLGCELAHRQCDYGRLAFADVAHLVPQNDTRQVKDMLCDLAQRARSRAELLEHIPKCRRGRSLDTLEPQLRGWAEI